jgi:glycine oxidase
LERGDFGAEASWAAGGMLAPQAEADGADDFFRLAVASRDLYPALAETLRDETGIDVALERSGTLYLAFTEPEELDLERRFRWQRDAGLRVSRVALAELRALEPKLSPRVRAALHFPDDVQVENRLLVQALVRSNERRGITLRAHTEALSLNITGSRVTGVSTATEELKAGAVVVAGGSWSSLVPFSDGRKAPIAIEPVRGQILCFDSGPRFLRHVVYSPRGYLVPRRDGRLLAGSTTEHCGFERVVTAGGLSAITTHATEIMPASSSLPLVDHWAGLRPRAADGLPVVGQLEHLNRLFYATGHYRNGILLAPITGAALAEEIVTGKPIPLMAPFGPQRFINRTSDARRAHG